MPNGARNLYPGPKPFKPEEYRIFAGRDHEISELASLIISHPTVLLYAQSGAGKTSLLNAGLAPTLKEKGVELLPVVRVGIPVPQTIPLDQVRNVYTFSVLGNLLPEVKYEDTWLRSATLADALARIPRAKDTAGEPVLRVVAFDQFEELFSHYPQRWPDRAEFFTQVADSLQKDNLLRVLFVLREDYLANFGEFAGFLPENTRTSYRLERLREPEALLAITRPLEGTRWAYADGVAETLVRDLMTVRVENPEEGVISVPGEFVEPVQLQVVCYSLFERISPTQTKITIDDLQAFGNPDEALQLFYEKAIEVAVVTMDIDEGELRSWFEGHLITPAGTRGLVFRGRDTTGGIPNKVVDILEAQYLIRPEVRSGSRWYELTHDRFIRPIQTSNLKWKEKNSGIANKQHLAISKHGVSSWNKWRAKNPGITPNLSQANLSGANLSQANLSQANLREANLSQANLSGVNLSQADLSQADLSQANLSQANLSQANLSGANLRKANLRKANLREANLRKANLREANLSQANLSGANLREANLRKAALTEANLREVNLSQANLREADLSQANLQAAQLIETNLELAVLTGCNVYGVSVWNLKLEGAIQFELIITAPDEPVITVDNLEVAQSVYLQLHNEKIHHIIYALTSKVVLILGRFTSKRKAVLDALRNELRKRNYLPVLFDFDKPASRDLTGTMSLLANMARFIIADLTDPLNIPHELATIVPSLRTTPVLPLRLAGSGGFSMFEDLQRTFTWVLKTHEYKDSQSLISALPAIIASADKMADELRSRT